MRVGRLLLRLLALLAVVAGSVAAAVLLLGGDASVPATHRQAGPDVHESQSAWESRELDPHPHRVAATAPDHGAPPLLATGLTTSWAALERSLPAQVGLSLAPLGQGPPRSFGPLQRGHAWSTIKVPILATLLRESGGRGLDAEEDGWARAALTASDNEAAAALFGKIEDSRGGLGGASRAVEGTLRESGDGSTAIATAPPPSGAISTYGQTEWSLPASVEFLRSLSRGCLLDPGDTDYVLGLMEKVIPEQRWGLGEANFRPGWRVAMKGGWGPEESASGPYLVRQIGIVGHGDTGVAMAAMAEADSGGFEAGVETLDRIAAWLQENLSSLGPALESPC